ncbi:uncharacterized protein LOC120288142 [Eucalyptus grandis]|uniref:uncharacterized protein LOC120288142 n=1 Tax=Eucalyptus grandis TaxID=71139 RepID=UPI00192EC8AE|nr:uncharacterized protein LOC120288142 [Eucalyptus grandis]
MLRSALSTFRVKEDEMDRKKVVCDCILSHQVRIKEETKRLATIRNQNSLKMTVASIKLLRNKRQAMVKQIRHDIMSGQDTAARVRVQLVLSLRFAFGYCIGSWCGFLCWT